MSGKPKNQEVAPQGSTIVLDVYFYAFSGGPLVDPESNEANYEIYDPSSILMDSGLATRISTGYYQVSYALSPTAEISDTWRIDWQCVINGATVFDSEYFRVVAAGSIGFGHDILITDDWINQIKKVLAYPDVDNILLEDIDIRKLCVYPALHYYFRKFPIIEDVEYGITDVLEIDYPDDYTFGVLDVRIVDKGFVLPSGTSFWDMIKFQQFGMTGLSTRRGYWGTPYNFGNNPTEEYMMRRQLASTYQNLNTFKYFIYDHTRKVKAFSTVGAKLNITWAKWSNDFSDVLYNQQFEVIKLAQAELLEHLGNTTNIVEDTASDIRVRAEDLISKAKELREEVFEKWNEIPEMLVMRE